MARKRRKRSRTQRVRYFDYSLFAIVAFLVCFGLVMLYSTSSYDAQTTMGDSMFYFKRQGLYSLLGLGIMIVVSRIDYKRYAKWTLVLYAASFLVMAMVKFTPLGVERNGARRWIGVPGTSLTFQPSEAMKIAVILFIPYLICKMGKHVQRGQGAWNVVGWGALAAIGVYKLTDHLSAAIVVLGITLAMLFVVYKDMKPFLLMAALGVGSFIGVSFFLGSMLENSENFRLRRILAWLNPEKYASNLAFQSVQGLYAIGSGGLFGKGLGNSAQKMLIPEVQNDMIMTVICEELGLFGALMVLLLFGMLLYRLMFIAQNAPDMYSSLVVTGVFAHIAIQVVLNIAVVLNLFPNTGITLPFISYGGTSIVFLLAEMGIALGVSGQISLEQ